MKRRIAFALSLAVLIVAGVWLWAQPGPEPLVTLLAGMAGALSFRSDRRGEASLSDGDGVGVAQADTIGAAARSRQPSLAVLPFKNLGGEEETDYFSEGIAEDVIAQLARIGTLRVISRNSVQRFTAGADHLQGADGLQVAAEQLGITSVLEGSVRRESGRIRIVVQLTDVATGQHLWAERYDRELTDVLSVQAEVAESVADALGSRFAPAGWTRNVPSVDPEAYRLHLLGRFHANKWSEAGWEKAVEYLRRAIELDGTFAAPRAALAYSYGLRAYMHTLPPAQAFERAAREARLALALDPLETDAHLALGLVSYWFHWDWDAALTSLGRAVELSPGNSTAQAFLGVLLDTMGRHEESMQRRERAYELDPLDPTAAFNLAYGLWIGRRFPEAVEQFERALELDPRSAAATYGLGMSQVDGGDSAAGLRTFERGIREVDATSTMRGFLGWAYGSAGREGDARRVLSELLMQHESQAVSSYHVALVFLGIRDYDAFFEWIERAYQERSTWMVWFHVSPSLDAVRRDPRFREMVGRMRLPNSGIGSRGKSP